MMLPVRLWGSVQHTPVQGDLENAFQQCCVNICQEFLKHHISIATLCIHCEPFPLGCFQGECPHIRRLVTRQHAPRLNARSKSTTD